MAILDQVGLPHRRELRPPAGAGSRHEEGVLARSHGLACPTGSPRSRRPSPAPSRSRYRGVNGPVDLIRGAGLDSGIRGSARSTPPCLSAARLRVRVRLDDTAALVVRQKHWPLRRDVDRHAGLVGNRCHVTRHRAQRREALGSRWPGAMATARRSPATYRPSSWRAARSRPAACCGGPGSAHSTASESRSGSLTAPMPARCSITSSSATCSPAGLAVVASPAAAEVCGEAPTVGA